MDFKITYPLGMLDFQREAHFLLKQERIKYLLTKTGIWAGKTYFGAREFTAQVLKRGGEVNWIIAPSYYQAETAQREFEKVIFNPEYPEFANRVKQNKTDRKYWLPGGTMVQVRTGDDPDLLRGPTVDVIWGDEVKDLKWETMRVVIGRAAKANGVMILTTTPNPRPHWLYSDFYRKSLKPNSSYAVVSAATKDNPYNPAEGVKEIYETYKDDFALQELGGEFVSFQGLVFPVFKPEYEITEDPIFNTGDAITGIAGIDFGFEDPKVYSFSIAQDKKIYTLDEIYQTNLSMDDFVYLIKKMDAKWMKKYNLTHIYRWADAADKENRSLLASKGIINMQSKRTYGGSIMRGIAKMYALIADGNYRVHERCKNHIKEFGMYGYPQRVNKNQETTPRDWKNHAMDGERFKIEGYFDWKKLADMRTLQTVLSQKGRPSNRAIRQRTQFVYR